MSAGDAKRRVFVAAAHELYAQDVRNFFLRRLRNAQDVRELTQEVWTRLLRVQRPEEIIEPFAYIYRAAANVLAEFRMRQRKERVEFDSAAAEYISEHPDSPPANDPASRLAIQHEIQQALAVLPAAYREILLLRICDGVSFADIGKRLGFSAGTTEQYFFRALQRLRALRTED